MLLPVLSSAIRVPAELPAPVNPRFVEPNGRGPSSHAVLLHQTAFAQTGEHPAVTEAALLCHVVHTDHLTSCWKCVVSVNLQAPYDRPDHFQTGHTDLVNLEGSFL